MNPPSRCFYIPYQDFTLKCLVMNRKSQLNQETKWYVELQFWTPCTRFLIRNENRAFLLSNWIFPSSHLSMHFARWSHFLHIFCYKLDLLEKENSVNFFGCISKVVLDAWCISWEEKRLGTVLHPDKRMVCDCSLNLEC